MEQIILLIPLIPIIISFLLFFVKKYDEVIKVEILLFLILCRTFWHGNACRKVTFYYVPRKISRFARTHVILIQISKKVEILLFSKSRKVRHVPEFVQQKVL